MVAVRLTFFLSCLAFCSAMMTSLNRMPELQAFGTLAPDRLSFLHLSGFSHSGAVGDIAMWLSLLLPVIADIHLLWEVYLSKVFAHFIAF